HRLELYQRGGRPPRCKRRAFTSTRLAYTSASVDIRTVTAITTIMVADGARGTAADRVGRCRAASVSPIGMVRGTSTEGGRATTDGNMWEGRFGGLLFRSAPNPPPPRASPLAASDFTVRYSTHFPPRPAHVVRWRFSRGTQTRRRVLAIFL